MRGHWLFAHYKTTPTKIIATREVKYKKDDVAPTDYIAFKDFSINGRGRFKTDRF